MTEAEAIDLAKKWMDLWNHRKIDEAAALFSEDCVFSSPTAAQFTGSPHVTGRASLYAYWAKAISPVKRIEFTLSEVLWHEDKATLFIVYDSRVNDQSKRVIEVFRFDSNGLITHGEAFYGAAGRQ